MTYQIKDTTRHTAHDGPQYATEGKRPRAWYEAEFRRLGGLGDVQAAYTLLQKARADHGDIWAANAHFEHIIMDEN